MITVCRNICEWRGALGHVCRLEPEWIPIWHSESHTHGCRQDLPNPLCDKDNTCTCTRINKTKFKLCVFSLNSRVIKWEWAKNSVNSANCLHRFLLTFSTTRMSGKINCQIVIEYYWRLWRQFLMRRKMQLWGNICSSSHLLYSPSCCCWLYLFKFSEFGFVGGIWIQFLLDQTFYNCSSSPSSASRLVWFSVTKMFKQKFFHVTFLLKLIWPITTF